MTVDLLFIHIFIPRISVQILTRLISQGEEVVQILQMTYCKDKVKIPSGWKQNGVEPWEKFAFIIVFKKERLYCLIKDKYILITHYEITVVTVFVYK